MTTNSQDRLIGATIDGRYRIQSRIARGGMAGVYLATDLRLERNVAIKIMHGHLVDDPAYAQKFITEARHTARLTHPNIVSVYDQGQEGDILFLVMEYLPGMTLRELLNDFGQLTVEQALDITTAVLQGLDAAHREGIMHRDVKPENVMLVDDGRIKVGDFGLARPVTSATQTGATLMGTIAYISPELLQRGTSDFRSDLYSVGIMLYEMLTGKQPFVGETPMQIAMQHANNPVPRAADLVPELPYELDEVIQWATAKNPQNRPKDALAFRDGIRKAIAHSKANSTESPTEVIDTIEHTRVLDRIDTAATQIIQRPDLARATAPERAVSANATGALTALSANRQRRGKLLAIIAVVVVLLTGGAGWWFGMGPGSLASQISVAGLTA
ncbi:MAG: Stk1 family Ser/Thr kinase, partial [Actinomycetota bacterium]